MDKERQKLIEALVEHTGWGPVSGWQGGDFRKLNHLIFDKTKVNISESTLRRILGKVEYPHLPSETTLNTLALFLGYESWRDFKGPESMITEKQPGFPRTIIVTGALIVFILAGAAFYCFYSSPPAHFNYEFSSKPLTHTLPNSVIFTYKVGNTTLPVFIQQSWDNRTRERVSPDNNTFASVYYRPGFYQAKLIIGNKIVKEHPLLIPTDGWLGLLYQKPVPTYLTMSEFLNKGRLEVTPDKFARHHIELEPNPVRAELYNVGNFKPVVADHAEFSAMIKCDYTTGAGSCGTALAFLITNGIPISIPVSAKGCIATLGLFNGKTLISGKTNDLSAFGVDAGSWVNVAMKTSTGKLQLLVNGKLAYQTALPSPDLKIVGVAFGFEGGGAARSITLTDNGATAFKAF
jgi:hypothetical protein